MTGKHADGPAVRELKDNPETLEELANAQWVRIPVEQFEMLDEELLEALAYVELEGTDFQRGMAMGLATAAGLMMRPKTLWAYPQRKATVARRVKELQAEIAAVRSDLEPENTDTPAHGIPVQGQELTWYEEGEQPPVPRP